MHENTVFTVEFSCYSSQIMNMCVIDEWFTSPIAFLNSINIPTQSPAEPRRLKIGLKLFKSSIVLAILVSRERKSLPYAYDYILIGNLHHVKKDEMHTSAMIQSCNPEIVEVNSALKFSEVSWVHQKRLRQRPTHIFFSFWDSATKCLHRSSTLILIWHKRSPSEAHLRVMIFLCWDSL